MVQKIGKDEKYDLILEKSSTVYFNEKDEITKQVAKELDKLPPFRP